MGTPPFTPESKAPLTWQKQSFFLSHHTQGHGEEHTWQMGMAHLQDQQLAGDTGAPSPADPIPSSFSLSFHSLSKASSSPSLSSQAPGQVGAQG